MRAIITGNAFRRGNRTCHHVAAKLLQRMGDTVNGTRRIAQLNDAAVALIRDNLEPGDRPFLKEANPSSPSPNRTAADTAARAKSPERAIWPPLAPPEIARRAPVKAMESFPLNRRTLPAKPLGKRDLDHGEIGLMDELLGEQHPAGLSDGDGGGPDVLAEKAAELGARHDLESIGQRCDIFAVEPPPVSISFSGP